MRGRVLVLMLLVPLVAAFAPAPKPKPPKDLAKDELKKLQGTWVILSMERGGARGRVATYDHAVIKDDGWSFQRAGREYVPMTLVLDPKAKPKAIDFLRKPPGKAGLVADATVRYRGIYQLDGDTLKVCYSLSSALSSGERPKEFTTTAGREYLLTLRRVKP